MWKMILVCVGVMNWRATCVIVKDIMFLVNYFSMEGLMLFSRHIESNMHCRFIFNCLHLLHTWFFMNDEMFSTHPITCRLAIDYG
jgi:hypothetical protein